MDEEVRSAWRYRNGKGLGGVTLMQGGNEGWGTAIQSTSALGNRALHRIRPRVEDLRIRSRFRSGGTGFGMKRSVFISSTRLELLSRMFVMKPLKLSTLHFP